MKDIYGFDHMGEPILAPEGWTLLPEGSDIPAIHREFTRNGSNWSGWCSPRRCRGTMTPLKAHVCGWVTGFAVPVEEATPTPADVPQSFEASTRKGG